ncbi:MAG: LuxR C-terminal-related transcriptional regulator [Acidimicrobiales bacterium]
MTHEERRDSIALTPRQWEVLRLLLQGVRVPAIAAKLGVTRSTIRNHLATIFRRCGVHTQSELIEFFHERAPIRVEFDGRSEVVGPR